MSKAAQSDKQQNDLDLLREELQSLRRDTQDMAILEQALERKNRSLEQLLKAARYLTSSLDVHEVLSRISTGAMQVSGATNCDIYLLSEDGKTLIPEVSIESEYRDEVLATPLSLDGSLTGKAVLERRALLINDAVGSPGGFHIPGTPQDFDERLIAAPLIAEGVVLGAMCISRMGEVFTEEDREMTEAYAAFASSVLRNAQAHRALKKEISEREYAERQLNLKAEMVIRNQNTLLELNKLDITDLDKVVRSVTEAGASALNVGRCSLWLFTDDLSELQCKDIYLKVKRKHDIWPSFRSDQYKKYIKTLKEVRVLAAHDSRQDERTREFTKNYFIPLGITACLDVPIRVGGKLSGVFSLEHMGNPRHWTLEEQDFATSLADIVALAMEASERRRSEEALRESEKKYRDLTNFLPSIIFEIDPDGRITFINKYAKMMSGYTDEDVRKGIRAFDVVIPEDRKRIVDNMRRLMNRESFPAEEFTIIRKDGTTFPAIIHSSPILQGERAIGLRGLILDITERKKAEEALARKNRNQELLLNAVHALTASPDLNTVLKRITSGAMQVLNAEVCNIYLLEPDGETLRPVVSSNPEYSKFFLAKTLKVNQSLAGRAIEMGCCIMYNDITGDTHKTTIPGTPEDSDERLIAAPLVYEDQMLGAMSFIRDDADFTDEDLALAETYAGFASAILHNAQIHQALEKEIEERKQAEAAIRSSEISYRGVFDSIAEAIYIQDTEGYFLDVNQGAVNMYGYSHDELIGQTPMFVAAPGRNDLDKISKCIKKAFKGIPQQFEFWGKRKNGEIFPKDVRLYKGVYFGQDVVIAVATDITERKQAEGLLQESEKKYRELVNSMPLSEFETDANANLTFWNDFFLDTLGYRERDLKKGMNALQLIHPSMQDKAVKDFERTLAGEYVGSPEFLAVRKDGTTFPAVIEGEVKMQEGKVVGFRGFILDLSEMKQTEQALRASEARYRYYIEHVSEGVFCFKPTEPIDLKLPIAQKVELGLNSILVECNDTFAQISEAERSQVLGRRVIDLVQVEASFRNLLEQFFRDNCRVTDFEMPDEDKKGKTHWFQISMFGEVVDGMLEVVWGSLVEITERKQAQWGLLRANLELAEAYNATLEGWSRALEMRERETAGHSKRVVDLTLQLAKALEVPESQLVNIRRGALLHDIGKMSIPDSILLKPSSLSEDEWVVMRQHPTYAFELLKAIPFLKDAIDIPYCHHERWNGKGYPRGLKGKAIPIAGRIFALVDVYDALTSDRPYRPAWSEEAALQYLREQSGKYFDPKVVDAFFRSVINQEN